MISNIFQLNNNAIVVAQCIGTFYALWFKPSGLFVMFEEPAYQILCMYAKNMPPVEIAIKLHHDFNVSITKSRQITNKFIKRINVFCEPKKIPSKTQETALSHQNTSFQVFSKKRYLIGNKFFTFSYGNSQLEQCFDPMFSHLITHIPSENENFFEVFDYKRQLIFRSTQKKEQLFANKDLNQLMGAVYQQIISLTYEIKPQDWMMNLHASGISDGHSAILFPAPSGSGKTTLAALLQAKGFTVITDDFTAVDRIQKHAFRLPAAISIKAGSLESLEPYYPQLSTTEITKKANTGKVVRYLPVENNTAGSPFSFPVKSIVFLNYTPGKELHFEKIERKTALPLLLEDAWVNPTAENVCQFFSWINAMQFYRLSYSNNAHAIQTIENLFQD